MSDLPSPARACANCGAALAVDARVCGDCGEIVHPSASSRAQQPAPAPEPSPSRDYATTDLKVGDVLEGTYQLERIIGRGGMGAVFMATDLKLGRAVAVKALSAQLADADFVSRFEREARVLGILTHPNIVTLHSVGRHQGVPFIVMSLIEGEPLRSYVDGLGGRLSARHMLPLAQQICSALTYIHSKGVIHRDLKPSNVMVSAAGHLTVFDLGIARPHDSNLTKTGVIFGTPGYMAPELIVGDKNLDGRLDLYALGVILFELLAGEPPFKEGVEDNLLRAHLLKARPDICALRPDLPAELSKVLQKAMAVEPKDRYPDADELFLALEVACGARQFHEAATIKRAPLSLEPLSGPAVPRNDDPEVTPKQLHAEVPDAATPRGIIPAPLAKGGPEATRVARSRSRDDLPATVKGRSRDDLPATKARTHSRDQLPAQGDAPVRPSAKHRRPAAASGTGTHPAKSAAADVATDPVPSPGARRRAPTTTPVDADELRPWYKRRDIQLWGGASVAALIALIAAAFFFDREPPPPKAAQPIARVKGLDLPPPPPPPKDEAATPRDIAERIKSFRDPTPAPPGTKVDTQRVRRVQPRARRTYQAFRGTPNYGELQIEVVVNGQPVEAQVFMNGEDQGPSPVFLPVKAGTHKIRIIHKPFPPSRFPITVSSGKSVRLEVELQPYEDPPKGEDHVAGSFEEEEAG